MASKTDCTNPKGHSYYMNGHVAKCQNSGCGKVQVFNPKTRSWEDAKK